MSVETSLRRAARAASIAFERSRGCSSAELLRALAVASYCVGVRALQQRSIKRHALSSNAQGCASLSEPKGRTG